MFAPWSIDCEGARLRNLVNHELVDKIVDKTAEQVLRRCDRPEGWFALQNEYPLRLKQARQLAEDLLDLYSPTGLVNHCGVFARCSSETRQRVAVAVHAAYSEESGIAVLQEPLRLAVHALATAVDRFRDLAQVSPRADDRVCAEAWHLVQQRAADLKEVLLRMPRGVVFP